MTITVSLGGVGIFLLGMVVMTDALKAMAGDALRNSLMTFTRTPATGSAIGALCTAILQSSSATTVAAVGFVGAELMSFQNALGVIFGANLGTTFTGWLVAIFGFKVKLGIIAFPIVFIGTVLKLYGRGRVSNIGLALAGFGLIFIGVTTLQEGMLGLHAVFDFSQFSVDSLTGRLQLVLLGIAFTLFTQSSSAGVAAALTALFSGLIGWQQAAAIVIGMDIGTTVTAAIATIGGSIDARRTGFSHVIYNLCTGVIALMLIAPYQQLLEWFQPGLIDAEPEYALVGFHSAFNLLGVLIVIPFTNQFAQLMLKLVPSRSDSLTRGLEEVLLGSPSLALDSVQRSVLMEYRLLLKHLLAMLRGEIDGRTSLASLQQSLDKTHSYLDQIITTSVAEMARLRALLHLLDHLQRLHERCEEDEDRAITARSTQVLQTDFLLLIDTVAGVESDICDQRWLDSYLRASRSLQNIEVNNSRCREQIAQGIADGKVEVPDGTDMLEAVRWVRRVSRHLSRINYHLNKTVLVSSD